MGTHIGELSVSRVQWWARRPYLREPVFISILTNSPVFPVPHALVRLVGSENPGEGRVEVFHAGIWGTICQNHWSVDDANVVCRELGYARSLSFPGFSTFSGGSGQVSL